MKWLPMWMNFNTLELLTSIQYPTLKPILFLMSIKLYYHYILIRIPVSAVVHIFQKNVCSNICDTCFSCSVQHRLLENAGSSFDPILCTKTVQIWFPACTRFVFFQEPSLLCIRVSLPPRPASTRTGSAASESWTSLWGTALASWPTGWRPHPGVTWGTA